MTHHALTRGESPLKRRLRQARRAAWQAGMAQALGTVDRNLALLVQLARLHAESLPPGSPEQARAEQRVTDLTLAVPVITATARDPRHPVDRTA
jgi:hypothetical protein